jgi:hypothetical protein
MAHVHSSFHFRHLSATVLMLSAGLNQALAYASSPIRVAEAGLLADKPAQEASKDTPQTEQAYSEELGIRYPTGPGIRVDELRANGQLIIQLQDSATPSKWKISLQKSPVAKFGETPYTRIEEIIRLIQANDPSAKIFDREELKLSVAGRGDEPVLPGELIYLTFPMKGVDEAVPGNDELGISGFSVNLINQKAFLYGSIFTSKAFFEQGVRERIAGIFKAIRIQPEEERVQTQTSRIDSGSAILEQFTPEVLKAVAEDDTTEFYRIFERGPDGTEREISWQQISTRLAPLSSVNIGSPLTGDAPEADDEEGLLVIIAGEIVANYPSSSVTVDVERRHWLSLDRSREQWSMAMTPRTVVESGRKRVETNVGSTSGESGIRTAPQPRSTITIITSEGTQDSLDIPMAPAPFIAVAEPYIFGRLLSKAQAGGFSADWYTLDRSNRRGNGIRKRKDVCTPNQETGGWILETNAPMGSFTQEFDSTGRRIRRHEVFNRGGDEFELILEQIEPARLLEIYAEKSLPTR